MEKLDLECLKYVSQDTLDNIKGNYKKIVGIECNFDLINENNKYVGRVILFSNANNRVSLDLIVQFRKDKIKWTSNKEHDGSKMVLIDPYWVAAYSQNPKVKVPVKVFDIKTNQIVTQMMDLTYSQFMKRKLTEFYGEWKHKIVASYDNFYHLFKSKPYYYAINSTVKHYRIEQEDLVKAISLINNEKKRIKTQWNKYLNDYFKIHQAELFINNFFNKKVNNVIDIKTKKVSK